MRASSAPSQMPARRNMEREDEGQLIKGTGIQLRGREESEQGREPRGSGRAIREIFTGKETPRERGNEKNNRGKERNVIVSEHNA